MSANRIMEIEITPEQERILEQVAAGHGLSPAAFVRFLLFEVYANSRLAELLGRVRVEGSAGSVPVAPGAYRREHGWGAER